MGREDACEGSARIVSPTSTDLLRSSARIRWVQILHDVDRRAWPQRNGSDQTPSCLNRAGDTLTSLYPRTSNHFISPGDRAAWGGRKLVVRLGHNRRGSVRGSG